MFRRTHVDEARHDHGAADVDEDRSAHNDTTVVEDEVTTTSGIEARDGVRSLLGLVAGLVVVSLIVVQLLLAGRLGFQLAEANPQSNFVEMVYDVSGPLAEPFEGILSVETLDGGGIFDPNILIAMGVYLVAALLVLALLYAIIGPFLAGGRSTHVSRRMHEEH